MRTAILLLGVACSFPNVAAFPKSVQLQRARVVKGALTAVPPPQKLKKKHSTESVTCSYQPMGVLADHDGKYQSVPALTAATAALLMTLPESAQAAATTVGPVPSALMAYAHFLGILGVGGGLISERFLIHRNMTLEEEERLNVADGIYGLSALSLLISGYFRITQYAKGWEFYKNEPLFWIKMASVAVLGGLSFFPAIILFIRDQARKKGDEYIPLSDEIVDRMTKVMNAEILALATIPLMATLMARGVFYVDNFPWAVGVVLYAVSLGGAGYKYGREAFTMLDQEKEVTD
jgi:uncharacterized membrane protein